MIFGTTHQQFRRLWSLARNSVFFFCFDQILQWFRFMKLFMGKVSWPRRCTFKAIERIDCRHRRRIDFICAAHFFFFLHFFFLAKAISCTISTRHFFLLAPFLWALFFSFQDGKTVLENHRVHGFLAYTTNAKIVYKIRVELYLAFKFICFWLSLVCLFLVSLFLSHSFFAWNAFYSRCRASERASERTRTIRNDLFNYFFITIFARCVFLSTLFGCFLS